MQEKNKKIVDKFSLKEVIILIVVTALASLLTGFAITNRVLKDKYKNDETKSSMMETFIKNYNYINVKKTVEKAFSDYLPIFKETYISEKTNKNKIWIFPNS